MGCSPSKGQLFTGIYHHRNKALQFGTCEGNTDHFTAGTEINSRTETEIASGESLLQNGQPAVQGNKPTVCEIARHAGIRETNLHLTGKTLTKENRKIKDKRIETDKCKRSRQQEQLNKTAYIQSNSDLSQAIHTAHKAACAYMTHNIPKFESLIKLLEKAMQTHLSLQPMVGLLSLQYKEINQTLEEIATEGEQMLETYRIQRALSTGEDDVPKNLDIPQAEPDISPDMLQYMLDQLIQKMRLVVESVTELEETSLEETSKYYNSLSQLLTGNLGTKRAVKLRLKQVLNCMESYTLMTLDSEDTALPSEDSGIGVENESHNSLVRYCSQQERLGSEVAPQSSYGCADNNLPDQACVDTYANKDINSKYSNGNDKPTQQQERKCKLPDQKMSNGFQNKLSRSPLRINWQRKKPTQYNLQSDQKAKNIRRANSADNYFVASVRQHASSHLRAARRSLSVDCLGKSMNNDMVQGANTTNNLQKPEWINKRQNVLEFNNLTDENHGLFKPGLTPSLTPVFAPVPPGKYAVRRLINTFSQSVCDIPNQKPLDETRFTKKKIRFLPLLTKYEAGVSSSGNNNIISYPPDQQFLVTPYNVEPDSFPPPPPEVLMENCLKKKEYPTGNLVVTDTTDTNCYAPQSQRATMQTVLLPTKHNLNISETSSIGPYFVNDSHQNQDCEQLVGAKEKDEAIGLSLDELVQDYEGINTFFTERGEKTVRSANEDSSEDNASTFCGKSCTPTFPLVSRARIPPSVYSTCHRVPSLSTSYSVNIQKETSVSVISRVQRQTKKDSSDEKGFKTASGLKSFYDARSVFCQENQSTDQSVKPFCRSALPRPWGETKNSRGKLQATSMPQTNSKNILCGSGTDHQLLLSGVEESQYQDSESTTLFVRKAYLVETAQGLEIPLSCSASGLQEANAKITDEKD